MQLAQYQQLFLSEARSKLKDLEDAFVLLERNSHSTAEIQSILITAHALKSDAATMNFYNLANALHEVEELFGAVLKNEVSLNSSDIDNLFVMIDAFRDNLAEIQATHKENDLDASVAFILRLLSKKNIDAKSVRAQKRAGGLAGAPVLSGQYKPAGSYVELSADQMESVLRKVNDLISHNQQVSRAMTRNDRGAVIVGLASSSAKLSELRQDIIHIKMMSVRQYFVFMARLVRDLSRIGKKFISFELRDNNLRFERSVLESVRDICVQLVKNAVDHGFREGEKGLISLTFGFKAAKIFITVSDTGQGINWGALAARALDRKLVKPSDLERLSPEERRQVLFRLGLSSKAEATLVSGHGIGWQSVRLSVENLNGMVTFESSGHGARHGTAFQIAIPLAPTMFRALTWRWGSFFLAVPLFVIENIIQLSQNPSLSALGAREVLYRGKKIPVVDVHALAVRTEGVSGFEPDAVAIIVWNEKKIAVPIPARSSEEELIIESIPCLNSVPLVAGVAISEQSLPVTILNHRVLFSFVEPRRAREAVAIKKKTARRLKNKKVPI